MTWDVETLVGPEGWTTRAELVERVDRGTVDAWLIAGKLVRLEPGVYATASAADRWHTRVAAAVRARRAVVSHDSARCGTCCPRTRGRCTSRWGCRAVRVARRAWSSTARET